MISDFFFVLKMLGFTVIVALVMQTRIGDKTIEDQFHQWLKASVAVDYVQEAIDGGVALTKNGYKKADTGIRSVLARVTKRHQGQKERGLNFTLKRHDQNEEDVDGLPHAKSHVNPSR